MKKLLQTFNLQLFDEGEGEGSTDAGLANQQQAVVVYGKASTGAEETTGGTASDTPPATEETFEDLINGKYKEDFEKRVKGIVSTRMKANNERAARYDAVEPVLKILATKYGQNPENLNFEQLAKDLQADDSLYEEVAMERGMSPKEFRMSLELDAMRAQRARNEQEEQARVAYERITREGEALKQFYPNFNLDAEMQNPAFGRLMTAGISVRDAYEVIHRNEINGQMMQYAAQKASEEVAKSVQANQARPTENGAGSAPAVVYKSDPSKLSKEDRKAIKERARRGEKIAF